MQSIPCSKPLPGSRRFLSSNADPLASCSSQRWRYVSAAPKLHKRLGLGLICRVLQEQQQQHLAAAESGKESPSPASDLRRIMAAPGVHLGPACHDALSAKLVQDAGFSFTFMSGFAVSAVRLGLPDTGLISYAEMLDQGRNITAAVSIPVIGDGDTGYGNAMNVKRTVKGYNQAGFAGILLEDQVSPKACGHTRGRKVVPREEAIARVRAAVDARKESGKDLVIIARTDARQAVSLEEALWRVEAFASAGADVVFIDALASKEEMRKFCETAPNVPKLANMLEGGGKTPFLSPMELEELGYKLVAYPLSLVGVSIRAMQDALSALKSGRMPSKLPSFEEIKSAVGFNSYYDDEKRYAVAATTQTEVSGLAEAAEAYARVTGSEASVKKEESDQPSIQVISPDVLEGDSEWTARSNSLLGVWSRVLRVKLTGSNGIVKLDVRIPAGFLDGLAKKIPGTSIPKLDF